MSNLLYRLLRCRHTEDIPYRSRSHCPPDRWSTVRCERYIHLTRAHR